MLGFFRDSTGSKNNLLSSIRTSDSFDDGMSGLMDRMMEKRDGILKAGQVELDGIKSRLIEEAGRHVPTFRLDGSTGNEYLIDGVDQSWAIPVRSIVEVSIVDKGHFGRVYFDINSDDPVVIHPSPAEIEIKTSLGGYSKRIVIQNPYCLDMDLERIRSLWHQAIGVSRWDVNVKIVNPYR